MQGKYIQTHVDDHVGVTDLGHRLPQQILGDGEVKQRIVGHRVGTLSLTPASERGVGPIRGRLQVENGALEIVARPLLWIRTSVAHERNVVSETGQIRGSVRHAAPRVVAE